ncbi:MAG: hypothetical protein HY897_13340 [Deltaproteobacteria bacterium]|nr:hypothetical protein [Deltaproteobacteria bacterium]
MWEYLKLHEQFIREALGGTCGEVRWEGLREFHDRQIAWMQHERIIHLIVTMFVALFAILALLYVSVRPDWASGALAGLLLILTAAYILHYFRLENGVQRWYHLANRIDERLGKVGARYEDGKIDRFESRS